MDITNFILNSKSNYEKINYQKEERNSKNGMDTDTEENQFLKILQKRENINKKNDTSEVDSSKNVHTEETNKNPLKKHSDIDAPYAELANQAGVVTYQGVNYQCNGKTDSISIGDMSKEEDVITIPLEEGGFLKVNINNIDSLAASIGMFSPADVKRILFALSTKNKAAKDKMTDQIIKVLEELSKSKGLK
ncbi:hypothetical protein [Anaeromicropila herbilytica]|uniref:Uncharacterized protein n=1 Tax=Anaeromicropila herbilytica TaxID=2785025 RepID=A0A7R7EJE4_9FIRM|nr:hypothetical protein [Anaeromicropila herbilytica]BCN29863.1 hypothetical protein bsdtb5_11580 [Anaeromicropila herbilytica]